MARQQRQQRFGLGTIVAVGLGGIVVGNMFSARDEPPPEYRLTGEFERTATAADVADTDPQPATLYQAPELQPEPEPWPEPEPVYIAPAPVTAAYFRNCSDARAQGAAPVRSGDPGYSSKLDRDGDGVGCE